MAVDPDGLWRAAVKRGINPAQPAPDAGACRVRVPLQKARDWRHTVCTIDHPTRTTAEFDVPPKSVRRARLGYRHSSALGDRRHPLREYDARRMECSSTGNDAAQRLRGAALLHRVLRPQAFQVPGDGGDRQRPAGGSHPDVRGPIDPAPQAAPHLSEQNAPLASHSWNGRTGLSKRGL